MFVRDGGDAWREKYYCVLSKTKISSRHLIFLFIIFIFTARGGRLVDFDSTYRWQEVGGDWGGVVIIIEMVSIYLKIYMKIDTFMIFWLRN